MKPPAFVLFGKSRTYYKSTIEVKPDSLYTFTIILNDGSKQYAWIETPEINIQQMNLPIEQPQNHSLTLSWLEKDFRYPQYLLLQFWSVSDGFTTKDQIKLRIRYPYKGSYTIDKKYIKYRNVDSNHDCEHRVELRAESTGALSEGFLEGGSIVCDLLIYQDVCVYK